MTPHRTPAATVDALRRSAREHLAEGRRSAARRALLDAVMLDPHDEAVRRDLADLVRAPGGGVPHGLGVGALVVVAIACTVLATACLIGGLDVTAALLSVAGLHTGFLIGRRRRRVA